MLMVRCDLMQTFWEKKHLQFFGGHGVPLLLLVGLLYGFFLARGVLHFSGCHGPEVLRLRSWGLARWGGCSPLQYAVQLNPCFWSHRMSRTFKKIYYTQSAYYFRKGGWFVGEFKRSFWHFSFCKVTLHFFDLTPWWNFTAAFVVLTVFILPNSRVVSVSGNKKKFMGSELRSNFCYALTCKQTYSSKWIHAFVKFTFLQ